MERSARHSEAFVTSDGRLTYNKKRNCTSSDDRQITHLICVRLKHLLNDFFRGCFGPFIQETTGRRPKAPPKKNVLGGHRLDE